MRIWLSLLLLVSSLGHALEWQEETDVARLFTEAGVVGTFVLFDPERGELRGNDPARAHTRYIPASTFKIANALIGLTTGAVADVDTVLPYGGEPQAFVSWERDMTLRDAMAVSSVPIYQELARRIGLQRMREQVQRLRYGNRDIGEYIDRFWLDGPLRISAVEQAVFIDALARQRLPQPVSAQRAVRDILLTEQGQGWKLYAKTGWVNAPQPGVGWWVGWVERNGRCYPFALNLDMEGTEQGPLRLQIGKDALRMLGALPEAR